MQTDFGNFLKNDQMRGRVASFSKKMLMEISDSFELLDEPKKGKFFRKILQILFLPFFKNS
ncbi:hypothetical protein LEP1GSC185_3181 [Leptospira licerasiae serovar Varillal str. VAR 010]|uniref:Uncharacterized protein n=1 Tax=Leptospira licerasiae str. MMD4847 TaxID=1049971 RepID=A0ABP2RI31_9LEPT|nr:hypothetical protein LEP1GSC185_3181 [Leptospira licerasiae serovar Varillal str. VAR 010]EJZ42584.1 hypothetical protein LEP1GSC178_2800 [Leptospira licerasiae str. MMD4847]